MLRRGSYLFIALATVGCGDEQAADDGTTPILFGATISRTGSSAVHTWGNAFELAASDATAGLEQAGFPTGKRLSFTTAINDTQNQAMITVQRAIELAQQLGAKMILDGTSNDSLELNKLAYDADPANDINVPIVCVACSSPAHHNPMAMNADPIAQAAFRNGDKWHFGLSMASTPQARVLWNILVDKTPAGNEPGDLNGDGMVKISTIAIDDAFGTGFQDAFQSVLMATSPMAILERTTHPKDIDVNAYDWDASIDALVDDQTDGATDVVPDVLIEFTFATQSIALAKAYAQTTHPFLFMHTHSMREEPAIVSSEGSIDGHEGTSYLPSDGASGEAFDTRFASEIGIPRQSQWDAHVYDGTFLTALATVVATKDMADPAQLTGAQIRDAMFMLNDADGTTIGVGPGEFAKAAQAIAAGMPINYQGASGPCDFNENGRALNRLAHWGVEQGAVSNIAVYDCTADPMTCPKQ